MPRTTAVPRRHGRGARAAERVREVECFDWPSSRTPAELGGLAEEFGRAGVELEALWVYESDKGGKIAAVAREPAKLRRLLEERGITPGASRCFQVSARGRTEPALEALSALSHAGIGVQYADVMRAGDAFTCTVWVPERDLERARAILEGSAA